MVKCISIACVLFGLSLNSLAQIWTAGPSMLQARSGHTATLLQDGRVLVVGGIDDQRQTLASAEIYDPETDQWQLTEPTTQPHSFHTATLLKDGRVLVVGGSAGRATSEVFDPEAGSWTESGGLISNRNSGHTATLLPDGTVMVVGGKVGGFPDSALSEGVESWDPDTGLWSQLSPLQQNRRDHAAVLLDNGRVLVTGGLDLAPKGERSSLASSEIFDPQMNTWSPGADLNEDRAFHVLVKLPGGDLLAIGGSEVSSGDFTSRQTSEYYQTESDAWEPPQNTGRKIDSIAAALLDNGDVLVVGGSNLFDEIPFSLVYQTSSGSWLEGPSPSDDRYNVVLTSLPGGRALATGGPTRAQNISTSTVEFFGPADFFFYPQLALGGGFTCIVQISNLTDQAWTGKAQLNGGDWPADQMWRLDGGEPSADSELAITLDAFETAEFRLSADAGPFVGWLTLQGVDGSRSGDIAPSFFYNFVQNSTLVDSIGVAPAQPNHGFTFPVFKGGSVNTGIAVRGTTGPAQLTLYGQSGDMVAQVEQEIDGAAFIDQIFPDVPDEFLGLARIEAVGEFYLLVVRQELVGSGFQITTTPATLAP